MDKDRRKQELIKQHTERITKYSKEEQQQALDNLIGSFSYLKKYDSNSIKLEAILK